MTKRSQLNFRLSPEEIDEFKAIAEGFGMSATDYFRAKFLDTSEATQSHSLIPIEELEKRAKLAEKIIRQNEIDKNPGINRLAVLHYSNLINMRMEKIVGYASHLSLADHDTDKFDEIIRMISDMQKYVDGDFRL